MIVRCLLLLCLLNFGNSLKTQQYVEDIYDNHRLPTAVYPENYKLEVTTHLGDQEGFSFKGKVWITLEVLAFCDNITLHVKNLSIIDEEVRLFELKYGSSTENIDDLMKKNETVQEEMIITDIFYYQKHDYMIIYPKNIISKFKKYLLYIPFSGALETGLLGYYRSSYVDKKSHERIWLAVTQFEPIHARQAFPCFDEPEMKATFDIVMIHRSNYTSLSNMPLIDFKKSETMPGFVENTFDTTPAMSTYLVAYVVSDFEFKESKVETQDDVIFRIYARRDAMNQVDYAADIGPKVLKFYEDYFKIKFPLPKIDMIAIPDFGAGAMENWGLITYRETALLFQPNVSSASSQHRVATVIAHELAHQYFGNLVTMKWWTDLWLNEGFATYIASLGVEYLHKEWKSLDEESVDNVLDIFKFDALKSSHPVSVEIAHPNQIAQIFDAISYQKGSTILRMMHMFLGEQTFREGVSKYLIKHEYSNAEQNDLWQALTEQGHFYDSLPLNLTVKEIMDKWTLQVGYPIINVDRNYDTNSAVLSQVRYLSDRYRLRSDLENCWWVPLTYTDSEEANFKVTHARDWLGCDDTNRPLPKKIENLPDESQWVLFNIKLAGLYKIKYDKRNYKLIVRELNGPNFKRIDTLNRAQLIDDAMDLAWSGEQDYGIALAMINYLHQEDEYIPWKSALDNLRTVHRLLFRSPLYGVFKSYLQHILEPIYEKLGGLNPIETELKSLDAVKHKILIASWSCRFQVSDCEERSSELFREWMVETEPDHINPIPVDLRSVVYCTAIKNGKDKEWSFLWNRYKNSNVGSERAMIIGALSCSKEQWILARYLDWSLNSTSGVRKQDAIIIFSGVARSEVGFPLAKHFFQNKVEDIYEYLYPDISRLTRYIKPLAEQMATQNEFEELRFLVQTKSKYFSKSTQGVKQALETIEINQQWKSNNYQEFSRFLNRINYKHSYGIDNEDEDDTRYI